MNKVYVNFPDWLRIGLGFLLAFVSYVLGAEAGLFGELTLSDDLKGMLASLVLIATSYGITAPSISSLRMSKETRFLLTSVVIVAGFVVNSVVNLPDVWAGIVTAALAVFSALFVAPPVTESEGAAHAPAPAQPVHPA
jgi:hypothetical protein